MSQDLQETSAQKDIATNWVTSSRFIFYVSVFALLALVLGIVPNYSPVGLRKLHLK